jgi:hypothetical protein
MIGNFLLIPIMISALADNEYSLYKVMQSFSGPLIMLNLGISTVTGRAVAKYRAADRADSKEKENTLALAFVIACGMAVLSMVLSMLMQQLIPHLYGNTYSRQMLDKAKWVFLIFSATTAVRIVNDTFKGCIIGNERFICWYGENTVQSLLRFSSIILLLKSGADVIAVAMVDFTICLLLLVFNGLYTVLCLKERFFFYHINKQELKSIASFSAAIPFLGNNVNTTLWVLSIKYFSTSFS